MGGDTGNDPFCGLHNFAPVGGRNRQWRGLYDHAGGGGNLPSPVKNWESGRKKNKLSVGGTFVVGGVSIQESAVNRTVWVVFLYDNLPSRVSPGFISKIF